LHLRNPFALSLRQGKTKYRASGWVGAVLEHATVLLDHGATQTQAQPHALFFGGEKRRE
jgi:hypothetical protein